MTWDASYVGIDVVEPSYGGLPEAITEANMVRLRLKRLLTISPRDFLIVQCKSTDAAGGITSVAFSVEDSRCPADKDYVRGEVMSGEQATGSRCHWQPCWCCTSAACTSTSPCVVPSHHRLQAPCGTSSPAPLAPVSACTTASTPT